MTREYFEGVPELRYRGPDTDDPFAYRYYDPDRKVLGKRMEDQLRLAVCYWHTFCWDGRDVFGAGPFQRPWDAGGDDWERHLMKLDAAFELFEKLGVPFFTFHDRDVAPEGETLAESDRRFGRMVDEIHERMERSRMRLLWGTANLFGHPRYAAGAATNPDPEVFACAAVQVRRAMEATHRLGGANYVLWGGREGYETLLNTDLRRELDQLGRFMAMVVDHKHRIGFQGALLIEPKPMEPTKHQYDFDTAAVHAFLRTYDLQDEVKVNIEVNHATLAGHSFQHEVAYAVASGLFGSVDANRGDPQLGWDTDQFPNDASELAQSLVTILEAGGFKTGGFNFDARLRRQSVDVVDLVHGHAGGIDTLALALLHAEALIEAGTLSSFVRERYAGWNEALGREILDGRVTLAELADRALAAGLDPAPRSGRQELLEQRVARVLQRGTGRG